jgi:hypothetical protein
MIQLHNISTPSIHGVRDMIFPNDGQQMIVVSAFNHLLLFFNRSSAVPHDYHFIGSRGVSYDIPHCLFYIDDNSFYLSSWKNNTIYRYDNAGNATSWTETLVLNASSVTSGFSGNHISVDNCGRFWFSLGTSGMRIFDSQGSLVGSFSPMGSNIFDTLILDNFAIYLSDAASNRIIRIDPNI